jgi:hypothetical protein
VTKDASIHTGVHVPPPIWLGWSIPCNEQSRPERPSVRLGPLFQKPFQISEGSLATALAEVNEEVVLSEFAQDDAHRAIRHTSLRRDRPGRTTDEIGRAKEREEHSKATRLERAPGARRSHGGNGLAADHPNEDGSMLEVCVPCRVNEVEVQRTKPLSHVWVHIVGHQQGRLIGSGMPCSDVSHCRRSEPPLKEERVADDLPSKLEANNTSLTSQARLRKCRADSMLVESIEACLKQFSFCLK